MKFILFLSVVLVGMVHAVHAQSLDIGGIELRLGQKADEALCSLSSYQVQYNGSSWIVSQEIGNRHQLLGLISATNNSITFINKIFDLEDERTAETYTRASKELRRRGGATCATREVEYTDGLIREFATQCGSYTLTYDMPFKTNNGVPVHGGVSIILRAK